MNVPVALILLLHAVVTVAVLSELIPRTRTLWTLRSYPDGYGVDRVRTWLKSAGLVLVAAYEGLIWADALFFNQTILGPFVWRWHLDAAVWLLLAIGAVQVSRLYWSVTRRRDREDIEEARDKGDARD